MTILHNMAAFACAVTLPSLTNTSITMAKYCLLDTYGVACMGTQQHDAQNLLHALTETSDGGRARVWGTRHSLPPSTAALINAFNAHVYDYDDSCYAGMTHPSAVLFPTILALADTYGASGEDVICALIAGWEISGRMGLALPNLLEDGWQCGSLFGGIGAAAAGARLLRLNVKSTLHAMSLLLCQTGGLRQSNGTKGKPFTLGKVAESAVTACIAARAGLTGSEDMLEGPEGFFKVVAKNTQSAEVFKNLGNPWIMDSHKVCVKRHPICSSAHAPVEAAERLVAQYKLVPADILSVHCATTKTALRYLTYHDPQNSAEAQFSLPYLIATVLTDGSFNFREHLHEEAVRHPGLRKLMGKITWEACSTLGPEQKTEADHPEAACLSVTTINRRRISHYVSDPLGFPAYPLSQEQYQAKFSQCVQTTLSDDDQKTVLKRINTLELLPFSTSFSTTLHG